MKRPPAAPLSLLPRCSSGEGAAAAGEHLLPRCNCFPAVAAPRVAGHPTPLLPHRRCPRSICATAPPLQRRPATPSSLLPSCSSGEGAASATLPPRCRFDSPAAAARRPRRGLGKASGERRSKKQKREKMMTKTKQKGREGAPYLLTWLSGEGDSTAMAARSPRQPVALRSPPARSCQVAQF